MQVTQARNIIKAVKQGLTTMVGAGEITQADADNIFPILIERIFSTETLEIGRSFAPLP